MKLGLRSLARDQRGAGMPEYALLLFAVLICSAAALKRVGPRVGIAGDVATRLLLGEDVNVRASLGSATSYGSSEATGGGASGASTGGASFGSGAANGSGSSTAGASSGSGASSGEGSLAGASGGPSASGGGISFGSTSTGSAPAGSGGFLGGTGSGGFGSGSAAGGGGSLGSGSYSTESAGAASNASSSAAGASDDNYPQGFLGGTGAPPRSSAIASRSEAPASGTRSLAHGGSGTTSSASQNTVNPAPNSAEGGTSGDGYTISAAGEDQMKALLAQAKKNADGKRPLGKCYHVVKTDIDEVGYGDLAKTGNTAFPKQIPSSDQEYAHQFADYMNAKGASGQTNASRLGLQKLPITNPYDAPAGSIIVVRAGTPGTRNPVAGDIVVAGGNGKFYNDGNMGYGGAKNFPKGNTYVLGIYAPK